jgi:hypothetical protein
MEMPWKLFGGIIVLWVIVGVVPFMLSRDVHDAAEFASTFEFVNALFGALAFGGVIWAIRLQTKELELQRLEVEETRDELRRSADAQTLSQAMHFLSALLAARNNVAQGYAAAAAQETGTLRPNQAAHRQHLIELEWLLQQVDCHPANPFALPSVRTLVLHQIGRLLERAHLPLQSALGNRATNHARSLLLEVNHALRELRRQLPYDASNELSQMLDRALNRAESVTMIDDFSEISQICHEVFDQLSHQVATELEKPVPKLDVAISQ